MALLESYSVSLAQTVAIGRALGDGFAWFFYERDQPLIDEHLKRERQTSVPMGVGGLGERATAKNLKRLGDRLTIYHGTTTFLRIGDVSLVDLKTVRVCGIGEIKTDRVNEQQIEVQINLIADRAATKLMLSQSPQREADLEQPKLPPKMQSRFQRQLQTMRTALASANDVRPDRNVGRSGEFLHAALDDLVARCGWKRFKYASPEAGLVIGALRSRHRRPLSRNLLGDGRDFATKVAGVEPWAIAAMHPPHPLNAIYMGSIGDPDSLVTTGAGPPITMWPLANETIEALLFADVFVTTLFNPAPFWRAIEARGFVLSRDGPRGTVQATRKAGERTHSLNHYDHFHRLIRDQLVSLDAVMAMVDDTLTVSADPTFRGRVNVRPLIVRPSSERTKGSNRSQTSDDPSENAKVDSDNP